MMRTSWAILFFSYWLLATPILNGQQKVPDRLPRHLQEVGYPSIQKYLPEEYNGTAQISYMTQDSKGVYYFANNRYILIYDGVTWESISTPNLGAVKSLAVNEKDQIFIGGTGDFGYFEADSFGKLTYVSLLGLLQKNNDLKLDGIRETHATPDGVFFNGRHKLFRWKNGKIDTWETNESPITFSVWTKGIFHFFQKGKGLMYLHDDIPTLVENGDFLVNHDVTALIPVENNKLLIGTRENGLLIFTNGEFKPFKTQEDSFLKKNKLTEGVGLSNNTIVLGTQFGGLVIVNRKGQTLHRIGGDKITSDFVLSLFQDKNGVLWATTDHGIARIEYPSALTYFSKDLGVTENITDLIRYDDKLFAGARDGLYFLTHENTDHGAFTRFKGIKEKVWDLETFEEVLLIGLEDGIYQLNDNDLIKISDKVPSAFHRSKIDKNRVYIPYINGVFSIYYDKGSWIEEKSIEGIFGETYAVQEDSNGNLLVNAYRNSLKYVTTSFLEKDAVLKYTDIITLDAQRGFPDDIGDLFVIDDAVYFVGWNSKKAYSFNTTHKTFSLDTVLNHRLGFHKSVNLDVTNDSNDIWFRIYNAKKEAKHFVGRRKGPKKYEVEELKEPFFKNWTGPIKIIEDSIIWYYWLKPIITRYDLRFKGKTSLRENALVRKVIFNNDSVLYYGYGNNRSKLPNLNLPFQNNRFRFKYALPSLGDEINNEYQVNLQGYDSSWSSFTKETQKDYTNIPEGDYTFKVRAKNVFGEISKEDSYRFTILPPWYRTWWAYLCYFFGAILILLWFSRLRSKQLRAKNVALEELVGLRTQEIKSKNEQLESQTEKLKELDTMKTRLFANISHEFRTPLTLIKGPVEKLEETGKNTMSTTNIKMIRRNTNRLLKLVNQLLDLSRLDSGKLELNAAEGDVFKCLRAAASSFGSHAAQRDIDYQITIPSRAFWASFDRDKLEKIAYNLLSNAFKFTPDTGRISIDVSHRNQNLYLRVSDTGQGIKPEKLPYIFDRFYQVDDSYTKEKAGSGIGLALTKELVDLMDGEIYVESEFEKGSVFKVVLSIQEIKSHTIEDSRACEIVSHDEDMETAAPKRQNEKKEHQILIIEDNNDMRYFVREQLEQDYEVLEASNGKEGLKMTSSKIPDLIITDLMIPLIDGITLCKELKSGIHTSHIPIVMLTAKAGIENKLEGLETGADDYLTKPFNARELQVRVKNLISERQKLRELYAQKPDVNPKEITVTSLDEKFLTEVLELLETKHIESEFGVPQMQEALGMSKTQLHRKLKALTDHPPGELLRNFRLKRAAQLLLQRGENVSQIAYSVGFNGLSYFTKCFKELYGVAPSDYGKKGV